MLTKEALITINYQMLELKLLKKHFISCNIDASRLKVIAAGEDTSVDKESEYARNLLEELLSE
jgi:hypothetical protein